MEIDHVILGVQVLSLLGFVAALFVPYKALVEAKDATIQNLNVQIAEKNERVKQLETQTPDALSKSLDVRVKIMLDEIGRLNQDKSVNADEIERKVLELNTVKENLDSLNNMLSDWDLVCPDCRAPVMTRSIYPIYGYSGGREVDTDAEFIQYKCGYSTDGQGKETPCQSVSKDLVSILIP